VPHDQEGRSSRLATLQWTAIGLLAASFVVSFISDGPASVVLNYVFLTLAGGVLVWAILVQWRAARRRS
jgi:hypothetical protein